MTVAAVVLDCLHHMWSHLWSASVPRILRGAAALLGNHDTARAHYDKALEVMVAIRHRPEIALIYRDIVKAW